MWPEMSQLAPKIILRKREGIHKAEFIQISNSRMALLASPGLKEAQSSQIKGRPNYYFGFQAPYI